MRRVAKLWRTEMTGAVSTFTYDAKDRLTQDATSAPLAHTYTYTYDSRDNILTNSESGGVVQMNYDAASRLTTSTAGGVTTTYTFDSNGNLTGVNEAGTLTTMVYDKENRLKEHKQGAPGSETAFTYDLNSLKQSTTSGLVTDQLVWDGTDMLGEVPAAHPEGAPLMPTRYNLAQGILFATTRFEPAATRTDAGADFIGSILIDFDENGDYIAERRYKPYGELLAGTATTYGWTGNTGSRATLLQYAEQYNRRRHYSTKLKQWTTRDPLWPDESAYGYVDGRPLTWTDPSGCSVGDCEFDECFFNFLFNSTKSAFYACLMCSKLPWQEAQKACNKYSTKRLSSDERAILKNLHAYLEAKCKPCTPGNTPAGCCTSIALSLNEALLIVSLPGSVIPTIKCAECTQKCEQIVQDEGTYSQALEALKSCIEGTALNLNDHKDKALLLLEILNAVL